MSKHEAVTTHTFRTDHGIIIVAELTNDSLKKLTVQFPGSGNTPKRLTIPDLLDLADVAAEVKKFLIDNDQVASHFLMEEEEPRLG